MSGVPVTKYVTVLGTAGFDPDGDKLAWWQPGSPFDAMMARNGFEPAVPEDPYVWSGDLDGVPLIGSGNDWEAAAANLAFYLRQIPYEDRNVVAHSHGGAVVLFAAAYRAVRIRSLITVGTPPRREVRKAGKIATRDIGLWLHAYDDTFDLWGFAGKLFDFNWRWSRGMDIDGMLDVPIDDIGHTGLLDGTRDELWKEYGLFDALRRGEG